MEKEDEVDPTYLRRFNDGYIIAKYMPELSEQLSKTTGNSTGITAMQDGRKQYLSDQVKDKFPDWLKRDRFNADKPDINKDKDRSIEPEK